MSSLDHLLACPPKVLIEIFQYVPNKVQVKLVCQEFYKIVCKMEDCLLNITRKNIRDYKMISRSPRTYEESRINLEDFDDSNMMRLTEIFSKHCNIKKIRLEYAAIDENVLKKFLNLLPKLEEITVDVTLYSKTPATEGVNLSLTNVKSFTSNPDSARLVLDLPDNTLNKLWFSGRNYGSPCSGQLLGLIFNKQKNIEDLKLNPRHVSAATLNLRHLKELRLERNYNNLIDILRTHDQITCLHAFGALRKDEFTAVFSLKFLQVLRFNVEVDISLIENLNSLIGLKELKLWVDLEKPEYKNVHLQQLEKLELCSIQNPNPEEIDQFAEQLPVNFPKLKHLSFGDFTTKAFFLLFRNVNLESLQVSNYCACEGPKSDTMELEIRNHNLKEFTIIDRCYSNVLRLIMLCVKNPQKLDMMLRDVDDVNLLMNYLKSCKRLTHLSIIMRNFSIFDEYTQDFLKVHGQNLKYVKLTKLNNSDLPLENASLSQKLKNIFGTQFARISDLEDDWDSTFIMYNGKRELKQCHDIIEMETYE